MDRRKLLIGSASLLAGGGLVFSLWEAEQPVTEVQLRLAGLVSSSVHKVGRSWLNKHPEEWDRAALTQHILGDKVPDEQLGEGLMAQITADYAQGRTASVQGWVISETAARLCALAALTA